MKDMRSQTTHRTRKVVRLLVCVAMVAVGVLHFVNPGPFVLIVPKALPEPLLLVYVSGVFEILLGVGLLPKKTRRLASYGLCALFVAVFPANVNMAIHEIQLNPTSPMPVWAMWARLPFQIAFIVVALWVGRADDESPREARRT